MKQDNHKFVGMRRDLHPISQDAKFLWDAKNIRVTAREGNTLMSITNEKGTSEVLPLEGAIYIGHATIGDYLIIFCKRGNQDIIYRWSPSTKKVVRECHIVGEDVPLEVCTNKLIPALDILYIGNLGFSLEHPIQAISDYESDIIQKVYWIDGINQPRMINVTYPEYKYPNLKRLGDIIATDESVITDKGIKLSRPLDSSEETFYNFSSVYDRGDTQFDFVPTLTLDEELSVIREDGQGLFPSGVIQYSFTYIYKYGQESNIVHTSPLLSISYPDRGGDPDKPINCSFKITIDNVSQNYDYIRIYSLVRTTLDAVGTAKRVVDIPITATTISYIDGGTEGDAIDPTSLFFRGGETISAGTIASLDNTLFLGDIGITRPYATDIDFKINEYGNTTTIGISSDTSDRTQENTGGFKAGETYRLGMQFQYKDGSWTEPVFIGDKQMPLGKRQTESSVPTFEYLLEKSIVSELLNKGFKRARPLIVIPDNVDKDVLAQGMVCPTLFKINSRLQNTSYAQSSWFLRPFSTKEPWSFGNTPAYIESIPEFRHLCPLLTGVSHAEIQSLVNSYYTTPVPYWSAYIEVYNKSKYTSPINNEGKLFYNTPYYENLYYVDQSIITLHSPDIELNESLQNLYDNTSNYKVRLVGAAEFINSYGDILMSTSSPTISGTANGDATSPKSGGGDFSLISELFYNDSAVDVSKDAKLVEPTNRITNWMVYLWHRSGSFNNDFTRGTYAGTRTAVLKKKVISNIKTSIGTKILRDPFNIEVSDLQLFNSNEVSLLKLKKSDGSLFNYYGNVDQLLALTKYDLGIQAFNADKDYETESDIISEVTTLYHFKVARMGKVEKDAGEGDKNTVTLKNISRRRFTHLFKATIKDSLIVDGVNLQGSDVFFHMSNKKDLKPLFGWTNDNRKVEGLIKFIPTEGSPVYFTFTSHYNSRAWTKEWAGEYKERNYDTPIIGLLGDRASNRMFEEDINDGDVSEFTFGYDTVRIKYKSTPHLVMVLADGTPLPSPNNNVLEVQVGPTLEDLSTGNLVTPTITPEVVLQDGGVFSATPCLWIAEVYRDNISIDSLIESVENGEISIAELKEQYTKFGGLSEEALQNNLWIPSNTSVLLEPQKEIKLVWRWGDTWYQRYDCLKTYPFTEEDENQIVEIGCAYCETRLNLNGRYDRNKDLTSNINIRPTNFNKINPVYSQMDNFFNYRKLDKDYYKLNKYPSQIVWSLVKAPGAINDEWTNIRTTSTLSLPSTLGRITSIVPWNERLYGFQDKGMSYILFNSRVQIQASDGVPIEISNSQRVEGSKIISDTIGCQSFNAVRPTPNGIYFLDTNTSSFYRFSDRFENLGDTHGFTIPFKEMVEEHNAGWKFLSTEDYTSGIRIDYDSTYGDVYIIPSYMKGDGIGLELGENDIGNFEYMCDYSYVYSEKLDQFTSRMSYGGSVIIPLKGVVYSIALDAKTANPKIWTLFSGDYNLIYNKSRSYEISFISNLESSITKIFDTLDLRADLYDSTPSLVTGDINYDDVTFPFNYTIVSNEHQYTNKVGIDTINLRKKFRIWRMQIPRHHDSMERIRNPWAMITLGMDNPDNKLTILHDLTVNYTI